MSEVTRSGREGGLRGARQLIADLRALGAVAAPTNVTDGALARVGLADQYATVETPLGPVYIAWSLDGLSLALRAASEGEFRADARALLGRPVAPGEPPERLARGAQAWLAGDDHAGLSFDLARLTPFERVVLMKAREIPRGEVRPYGWIAREIGHPGATRAVGTALARNPIPLFIPLPSRRANGWTYRELQHGRPGSQAHDPHLRRRGRRWAGAAGRQRGALYRQ